MSFVPFFLIFAFCATKLAVQDDYMNVYLGIRKYGDMAACRWYEQQEKEILGDPQKEGVE